MLRAGCRRSCLGARSFDKPKGRSLSLLLMNTNHAASPPPRPPFLDLRLVASFLSHGPASLNHQPVLPRRTARSLCRLEVVKISSTTTPTIAAAERGWPDRLPSRRGIHLDCAAAAPCTGTDGCTIQEAERPIASARPSPRALSLRKECMQHSHRLSTCTTDARKAGDGPDDLHAPPSRIVKPQLP